MWKSVVVFYENNAVFFSPFSGFKFKRPGNSLSLSKPKPPAPVNNGRLEVGSKPLLRGGRQSSDDDVTVVSQTGPLHELTSNTATRKMVEKVKKVCVFDIGPDKQEIVIFFAPAYSRERYRSSTFCPSVILSV